LHERLKFLEKNNNRRMVKFCQNKKPCRVETLTGGKTNTMNNTKFFVYAMYIL